MFELTPFKVYNQLNDWTVDGDGVDENAYNNCGPESLAMTLYYLTGVELPADFIKDAIYGQGHIGYTDTNDLANFMRNRTSTPCDVYSGLSTQQMKDIIFDALSKGFPVIALYRFVLNNPFSGHFCPIIAVDDGGTTRANPYGGYTERMDWETFNAWHKGWIIVMRRPRDAFFGL